MRSRSLSLGFSAFLSATLLSGTAQAYGEVEQEPRSCHEAVVAAGMEDYFSAAETENLTVAECVERIAEGKPSQTPEGRPAFGQIGMLFGGIASVIGLGVGAWTSVDWTDILLRLGSL